MASTKSAAIVKPLIAWPSIMTGDFFRWIVGGVLAFAAAITLLLWQSISADVHDLKVQVVALSVSIAEVHGDIKVLQNARAK